MATSNDGSAGGGFPSLTMGSTPVLKIDHSDVAGSFRSYMELFIIHQKMKRLEMGEELIYVEDGKGKPVVVDRKDRFGDEAQLLSLLQCIGEDACFTVTMYGSRGNGGSNGGGRMRGRGARGRSSPYNHTPKCTNCGEAHYISECKQIQL